MCPADFGHLGKLNLSFKNQGSQLSRIIRELQILDRISRSQGYDLKSSD